MKNNNFRAKTENPNITYERNNFRAKNKNYDLAKSNNFRAKNNNICD